MSLTFRYNDIDECVEWTVYRFNNDDVNSSSYVGWIRQDPTDDSKLVCVVGQYTKFTGDELLEIGNYMKKIEEEAENKEVTTTEEDEEYIEFKRTGFFSDDYDREWIASMVHKGDDHGHEFGRIQVKKIYDKRHDGD